MVGFLCVHIYRVKRHRPSRAKTELQNPVATRLVETLDRLLGMRSNPSIDALLVSGLDLVHGLLLLHPKSASLFAREGYMNVSLERKKKEKKGGNTLPYTISQQPQTLYLPTNKQYANDTKNPSSS